MPGNQRVNAKIIIIIIQGKESLYLLHVDRELQTAKPPMGVALEGRSLMVRKLRFHKGFFFQLAW